MVQRLSTQWEPRWNALRKKIISAVCGRILRKFHDSILFIILTNESNREAGFFIDDSQSCLTFVIRLCSISYIRVKTLGESVIQTETK